LKKAAPCQPVLESPSALSGDTRPLGHLVAPAGESGQQVVEQAAFIVDNGLLTNDLGTSGFKIGRGEVEVPVCTQQ
jgi:hypothetical protein